MGPDVELCCRWYLYGFLVEKVGLGVGDKRLFLLQWMKCIFVFYSRGMTLGHSDRPKREKMASFADLPRRHTIKARHGRGCLLVSLSVLLRVPFHWIGWSVWPLLWNRWWVEVGIVLRRRNFQLFFLWVPVTRKALWLDSSQEYILENFPRIFLSAVMVHFLPKERMVFCVRELGLGCQAVWCAV